MGPEYYLGLGIGLGTGVIISIIWFLCFMKRHDLVFKEGKDSGSKT